MAHRRKHPKAPPPPPLIPADALQALLHMDRASGAYDDETRNAVRSFQRLKDMPITGVADQLTLDALHDSQPMLLALQHARNCTPTTDVATSETYHCMPLEITPGTTRTVVIDAGHGPILKANGERYYDSGETVRHGEEAAINLAISMKLATLLRAEGYTVVTTRDASGQAVGSRFLARLEAGHRREVAHMSIHADDAVGSAHGIQVYYSKFGAPGSSSVALAQALGDGRARSHSTDLLDPFILGNVPAVLIETGNMRNKQDLKHLTDDAGQDAIAQQIVEALKKYHAAPAIVPHTLLTPALPPLSISTVAAPAR